LARLRTEAGACTGQLLQQQTRGRRERGLVAKTQREAALRPGLVQRDHAEVPGLRVSGCHLHGHHADTQVGTHDAQRGLEVRHDHAVNHRLAHQRRSTLQHELHGTRHGQAHMRVLQRLLEAQGVKRRQRMRGVHHNGQVVAAVGPRLQFAQVGCIPADAQRGTALADAAHHLGAEPLLDVHLEVLVGRVLQEFRHIVGQRLGHDRSGRQHPHLPLEARGITRHVALDAEGAGEHGAGMLQQRLAGGRGLHPAAAAHQQRRTHSVFQLRQPLADGRANNVRLLARTGNVARLAHGHKQAQAGEVEFTHEASPGSGIPAWNGTASEMCFLNQSGIFKLQALPAPPRRGETTLCLM